MHNKMASEAQRLIGISLTKIAQSRQNRGGVSLHKNLLVATVLQKARYIFMEEAYNNMVHYQTPVQQHQLPVPVQEREEQLVALTAEEVGGVASADPDESSDACNKENRPPNQETLTYLDLDKAQQQQQQNLKRRRAVSEWETEEAVQSILPKRTKQQQQQQDEDDDDVFLEKPHHLEEANTLADAAAKDLAGEEGPENAMEIDRITSLVSIFSFSMSTENGANKLNRSVSTPDLCSTQAKDAGDAIQRPFIAMAV